MSPITGDMSMKMEITKIGIVLGGQLAMNWEFDGHGEGIGIEATVPLLGGYTIEELEAIADG